MLILTRRVGESLIIDHNIQIINLGVKGRQVRFGINAPKDVLVNREEVYQKLLEQSKNEESDQKA